MKYQRVPAKHIGQVGDSGIATLNGDDYLIAKYNDGWRIVGSANLAQPYPKDSQGQDGEIRRSTHNALLYKSSGKWYKVDVTAINRSISSVESSVSDLVASNIDMMLIATAGLYPFEKQTPTTLASLGYLEN